MSLNPYLSREASTQEINESVETPFVPRYLSAIRNLRLKALLSPVPARTDFQSHPVVHASSTDICIHYVSYMPEVPVSTCVWLSPVPMCLTVHFYKLIGFVQKAKPFLLNIDSSIDISIMLCTTVWACPLPNT